MWRLYKTVRHLPFHRLSEVLEGLANPRSVWSLLLCVFPCSRAGISFAKRLKGGSPFPQQIKNHAVQTNTSRLANIPRNYLKECPFWIFSSLHATDTHPGARILEAWKDPAVFSSTQVCGLERSVRNQTMTEKAKTLKGLHHDEHLHLILLTLVIITKLHHFLNPLPIMT